jgi:hypothetical protein
MFCFSRTRSIYNRAFSDLFQRGVTFTVQQRHSGHHPDAHWGWSDGHQFGPKPCENIESSIQTTEACKGVFALASRYRFEITYLYVYMYQMLQPYTSYSYRYPAGWNRKLTVTTLKTYPDRAIALIDEIGSGHILVVITYLDDTIKSYQHGWNRCTRFSSNFVFIGTSPISWIFFERLEQALKNRKVEIRKMIVSPESDTDDQVAISDFVECIGFYRKCLGGITKLQYIVRSHHIRKINAINLIKHAYIKSHYDPEYEICRRRVSNWT